MTDRYTRMLEDRHLRNSARTLVDADIRNLKSDLSRKSIGERTADRVREGALDLYEEAVEVADDNKGALSALLAAVIVWFARNPILSAVGLGKGSDDRGEDYAEGQERRARSNR